MAKSQDATLTHRGIGKPKQSKSKLSYCQRLIQSLDRARFGGKDGRKYRFNPSKLLRLPVELRQQTLYDLLEDDELLRFSISDMLNLARPLSSLCKTFQADIEQVIGQWCSRRSAIEEQRARQTASFDSYITELMAPIATNSRLFMGRSRISRGKRSARESNKKMKRASELIAQRLQNQKMITRAFGEDCKRPVQKFHS